MKTKRCLVHLCLLLFVGGIMSCLHYLCLFVCRGVQHIVCCVILRIVSASLDYPFVIVPSLFSNVYHLLVILCPITTCGLDTDSAYRNLIDGLWLRLGTLWIYKSLSEIKRQQTCITWHQVILNGNERSYICCWNQMWRY